MLGPCKGLGDKGTGMEDTLTPVTALGAQRQVMRWARGWVGMCGCSSHLLHIVLCVWVSFLGGLHLSSSTASPSMTPSMFPSPSQSPAQFLCSPGFWKPLPPTWR